MMHEHTKQSEVGIVQLPSPTAMPMILAFGVALILTGMVTNIVIGLLGLLLSLWGGIGWFFQVIPDEKHVDVPVLTEEVHILSSRKLMERLPTSDMHRKILPIETFRLSTGIKGGIAGGFAMVIPAAIFGLLRYHSIWYPANLLAAGGFVQWIGASDAFLGAFHMQGLLAAIAIHGLTSVLVGLLYGAMLPMYPRYPIVTAGLVAPLMFTGILHSALGVVSPILNERIHWYWFFISLITYGLVCGFVVNLHTRVRTAQFRSLPFSVRAGIHSDTGARIHESPVDLDKREPPQ
jgi:hypothetical protein